MSELPSGWASAAVADLIAGDGTFSDGDWVESKDQDPSGAIRLLQLADVGDGVFVDKSNRFVNDEKFEQLRCTEVFEDDVLIARMPDPLGRACLVPKLRQRCITVVDVAIVRPGTPSVKAKWLMHFLNAPPVRERIELQSSGTTRRRISRGNLAQLELPVPPLPEQNRIADKLDALLARVDACRERLDRVPTILKRFRQAVLAAATSGELTREWREARGLEAEWRHVLLQDVCNSIADGDHQAPPKAETGVPFITIGAINTGVLRLEHATRYVPAEYFRSRKPERRAQQGDVLFSVTGSIGIAALVDTDAPFVFQRHIAVLRPNPKRIGAKFLFHRLSADDMQHQGASVATGTAQLTIPLGGLRSFAFSLPSIEEQEEIVRRVDGLFTRASALETRCQGATACAALLTPSTLAKAFRGELVPQDAHDEPASRLLARVRNRPSSAIGRPKQAIPRRKAEMTELSDVMKKLVDVLEEAGKWMSAQEAFRNCGIADGSQTDLVEGVYAELKDLERSKRVAIEAVRDAHGRKLHDRLKFIART